MVYRQVGPRNERWNKSLFQSLQFAELRNNAAFSEEREKSCQIRLSQQALIMGNVIPTSYGHGWLNFIGQKNDPPPR